VSKKTKHDAKHDTISEIVDVLIPPYSPTHHELEQERAIAVVSHPSRKAKAAHNRRRTRLRKLLAKMRDELVQASAQNAKTIADSLDQDTEYTLEHSAQGDSTHGGNAPPAFHMVRAGREWTWRAYCTGCDAMLVDGRCPICSRWPFLNRDLVLRAACPDCDTELDAQNRCNRCLSYFACPGTLYGPPAQ
jgi:hypothetical protein